MLQWPLRRLQRRLLVEVQVSPLAALPRPLVGVLLDPLQTPQSGCCRVRRSTRW